MRLDRVFILAVLFMGLIFMHPIHVIAKEKKSREYLQAYRKWQISVKGAIAQNKMNELQSLLSSNSEFIHQTVQMDTSGPRNYKAPGIYYAIQAFHLPALEMFKHYGAKMDYVSDDFDGGTLMHIASSIVFKGFKRDYPSLDMWRTKWNANPDELENNQKIRVNLLKKLVELGALIKPDKKGTCPFEFLRGETYDYVYSLYKDKGCKSDQSPSVELHWWACWGVGTKTAEILMNSGADPFFTDGKRVRESAFHRSMGCQTHEHFSYLLKKTRGKLTKNPLLQKIFEILAKRDISGPKEIKAILKVKNESSVNGFTPLILATYFKRKKAFNILVVKKADLNATDENGDTALSYAIRHHSRNEKRGGKAKLKTLKKFKPVNNL